MEKPALKGPMPPKRFRLPYCKCPTPCKETDGPECPSFAAADRPIADPVGERGYTVAARKVRERLELFDRSRSAGVWDPDKFIDLYTYEWSRRVGSKLIRLLGRLGAVEIGWSFNTAFGVEPSYRVRVAEWAALDAAYRMGGEDAVEQMVEGWLAEL